MTVCDVPRVTLKDGSSMRYQVDTFADPWAGCAPAVLMVHGLAESSEAWYGWVPGLARRFQVFRVDLRGHGLSDDPGPGYAWSVDGFVDDLVTLLDDLAIDACHVVGAKLGGTLALALAARHPERVLRCAVTGPLIDGSRSGYDLAVNFPDIRAWATATMRQRLGTAVSDEQCQWWVEMFCGTPAHVVLDIQQMSAGVDLLPLLPSVRQPTLVTVAQDSLLHSHESMAGWVQRLPLGELDVVPGDGYHLAASMPDVVGGRVLEFLEAGA
jgi:3-oxoadipate enol-lactonase